MFAGEYDKNSDIYSVFELNEPTHVLANKNTSLYIVGNYLFSSHLIWIAGIHFTKLLFMMSDVPWDNTVLYYLCKVNVIHENKILGHYNLNTQFFLTI